MNTDRSRPTKRHRGEKNFTHWDLSSLLEKREKKCTLGNGRSCLFNYFLKDFPSNDILLKQDAFQQGVKFCLTCQSPIDIEEVDRHVTKLIADCVKGVDPHGRLIMEYKVGEISLCKDSFAIAHGISNRRLERIINDYKCSRMIGNATAKIPAAK